MAQAELDELQSAAKKSDNLAGWESVRRNSGAYEDALNRKNNALLVMEQTNSDYEEAVQNLKIKKGLW